MSEEMSLSPLFHPRDIALVGASARKGKIGYTVLANLIDSGFAGGIYPVNPREEEILGYTVTRDLASLPLGLDLAILTIPRDHVLSAMRELAERRIKAAIVISAGFKEVDRDGYRLEQEIGQLALDNGIALLGPNCLGLINTAAGMNATFAAGNPAPGNVAFFSQSGALCQAILDWAMGENMGFSSFISLGNKAVINEAHMLRHLESDPKTDVVLGYIENVSQGEIFLRQAREISRKKPVLMIKSGTSAAGAKAASSHTGAIAGSDRAYEAAFEQGGIIRVRDISTLFTLAQAFSCQPLPRGPNLAVVTNSGGPGIMTADACDRSRLQMARLGNETIEAMRQFLPSFASLHNPVDIIGDADAERYRRTTEAVVQDPNVDAVMVLLTPTGSIVSQMETLAEELIRIGQSTKKTMFVCLMGKHSVLQMQQRLLRAGIPTFHFPEPVISSLEAMYTYSNWRSRPRDHVEEIHVDREKADRIVDSFRCRLESGQSVEIVEYQAQELLQAYGLPSAATEVAKTSDEAARAAERIGFPVVLKVASPDISHKSDAGGVRVGLQTAQAVKQAFLEITSVVKQREPGAYIHGCLVQEMAPKGMKEIIAGFSRDEQFGPMLMFGLGGIYVEVLKDISFQLAPLSRSRARDMIRGIKSYMLLKGVRGEEGVRMDALEDILLRLSRLATDFPDLLEADLNPVLVDSKRALIADVRLTLALQK